MVKRTRQLLAVWMSLMIAVSSFGYQDPDSVAARAGRRRRWRADERHRTGCLGGSDRAVPGRARGSDPGRLLRFRIRSLLPTTGSSKTGRLTGTSLMQAVNKQSWDSSVKALTEFPSVLNNLAKNLTWTSSLGEAYHNQPADVMAAIQRLRAKAKAAGNLKSTPQITVVQQSPQTILIQPANPQVVYVPEYNPAVIYGTPYVTPGYTAGEVAAAGVIGFGAGIAIGALEGGGCCGWGWNSWNCDWHGGAVVYNHNNFYGNSAWHGGYYNGGYHDGYGYHNAYNRTTVE